MSREPNVEHHVYQSPFTWRYGSEAMRTLWSEIHRRRLMRRVWLALAETQAEAGLVAEEALAALRITVDDVDIQRAEAIEARTRHDVMAELLTWAEQAPAAKGSLHLGATSADITDNVDAFRLREGLDLLEERLTDAIASLAGRVDALADRPCLGWTHLQPASPTTVGYRLSLTLTDLVGDLERLRWVRPRVRGKGFKGAVGTRAGYASALAGTSMTAEDMDVAVLARLGLPGYRVTSQVYSRKQDLEVLELLAGIAASAARFAFNARVLQSPPFGEWSEGFGEGQVGSSAMPWKRNPIDAENINSLARYVAALPGVAWENAANSLLERTLDDSANRRVILPNAFLATDEILGRVGRIASKLAVDEPAVDRLLDRFGVFAAAERVLLEASAAGGDRQALHERIRGHSLSAWADLEAGQSNTLPERLAEDPELGGRIGAARVRSILSDPGAHVGDAPILARQAAARAREQLDDSD